MTATRTYRIVRHKGIDYRITPDPQPELSTCRSWTVKRLDTGAEYTVRCDDNGVWTCSCPNMTEAEAGRRNLARRDGDKHTHMAQCSIGEHKFLPALADGGQECVRCGVSIAQHEYETYGPPDPPMRADRRDY